MRAHFFSVLYCFYLLFFLRTLRSQHDQGGGIFNPNNRQAGGSERNTCGTLRFQGRGEMCSKSIGNGWNNPCTLSDLYGKWDDVQRSLDGWTTLFLDKNPPTCLLDPFRPSWTKPSVWWSVDHLAQDFIDLQSCLIDLKLIPLTHIVMARKYVCPPCPSISHIKLLI